MALFHLLKVKARFYHIGKSRVNQKHASRIYCRNFAIVPSSSLDVHTTGRCTLVPDQSVPRKIPLASSIRLRNSSVSELRQEFINFFHNHQHSIVAPASIFPKRHEGSYFVNAVFAQSLNSYAVLLTHNHVFELGVGMMI
ncbi:unnamed protein product [Heterobilharzia americana]|nr:unnamed protein product [Heterobilharzia americana]